MNGGSCCPVCGTPGDLAAGGECPGCLLAVAFEPDEPLALPDERGPMAACGGYLLEEVIGRGGHGIVFRAVPAGGGEPLALKMLAAAGMAGPDELRRFRLEVESIEGLQHRHIVRVRDAGESDGSPYFVMDLAQGGTVADRLRRNGGPDSLRHAARENVRLMVKVARAVHFAHERGILHRDLKPANILLDGEDEPLVSDFGLARLIHQGSGVTMTGAALGTPSYMSPEQASGAALTTATDLYSLGAILYHLLTGKAPFEGETPLEVLRMAATRDVTDPRTVQPWMDRDLATVVLTALRREPERRYASVAVFADDLERWLRGEAVLARPLPAAERWLKWCRRHPVAATLGLSASVASLVVAVVFVAGSVLLREERNRALRQEAIARANARQATLARDESRLQSYAADMYLAYRAFEDGHLGLARRMLAGQNVRPGLPDLRGFEWHALAQRCRGDDVMTWADHAAPVTAVAFDPAGTRLACASRNGSVVLRSIPDGRTLMALPLPGAPTGAAEIALMAAVAARSAEMKALLLSGAVTQSEYRMRGRPSRLGEISTLAWSPDGGMLATAGLGSYVRVWSLPSADLVGIIPVTTATSLSFTPDGGSLLVMNHSHRDQNILELRIYQIAGFSLAASLPDLQRAHAFSPVSGLVALIPRNEPRIMLKNLKRDDAPTWIDPGGGIRQLAFSPDGQVLYGVEAGGTLVHRWRVEDGRRLGPVFAVHGGIRTILPSPDGKRMASACHGQTVSHQDVDGRAPAALFTGHEDVVLALDYSPDGRWLATGGNDHTSRLWNGLAPDAFAPGSPGPEDGLPEGIPRPASGQTLWTRDKEGYWVGDGLKTSLRRYDRGGTMIQEIAGPPGRYLRLFAAQEGGSLAAFAWPRSLAVWTPAGEWSPYRVLSPGTVGPVLFSPCGSWIASGGDDNVVTIRSVDQWRVLAELRGHQGQILELAVTPDGRTLVSSAADSTTRLWHAPTWRELGTLHRGENLLRLEFKGGGMRLEAVGPDGNRRSFGLGER